MFCASKPDPRALFVMSFCVYALCAFVHSRLVLIMLVVLLTAVMAFMGRPKTAGKLLLTAVLWISAQELVMFIPAANIKVLLSILLAFSFRLLPVLIMGMFMLSRIRINEFIIALERLHIPGAITIPFSMACRFIPTARLEIRYITEAIKMRGMSITPRRLLRHPLKCAEQLLIPLLIRSSKLSEELSSSALCKGIEVTMRRSSVTGVRFDRGDVIWSVSCLVITAALFWLQSTAAAHIF